MFSPFGQSFDIGNDSKVHIQTFTSAVLDICLLAEEIRLCKNIDEVKKFIIKMSDFVRLVHLRVVLLIHKKISGFYSSSAEMWISLFLEPGFTFERI